MNSKEVPIESRKVAGPFRQFQILFWKNGKLLLRNKLGTFGEMIIAFLFVFIVIIIRYLIDTADFNEDTSITNTPRSVLIGTYTDFDKENVYYYPENDFVKNIVESAMAEISRANRGRFRPNVVAVESGVAVNLNSSALSVLHALIAFPDNVISSFPDDAINYTIYTPERDRIQYKIDEQFYTLDEFLYEDSPEAYCRNKRPFQLYEQVFNPLKHAIDSKIIESVTGRKIDAVSQVLSHRYNCPASDFDILKKQFSFFIIILIQFAYVFTLIVNLGYMITEKQTKMKEYLKLVGIKWYVIWGTWFCRMLFPYIILSLLISGLSVWKMDQRYGDDNGFKSIFGYADFTIVASVLLVYSLQTSVFGILLGQVFSKPFIGKMITVIIWIFSALNLYDDSHIVFKYFLAFFPNCGLQFVIKVMLQFERSKKELSYSNMYTNLFNDPVTVGGMLLMMMAWTVIYLPIAWYIERIFPGEYGAPLPFYFPFMKSYWFKNKDMVGDVKFTEMQTNNIGFEKDPDLNCTVSIKNITKKFRIGFQDKTVVDNLSINFYENQITGLLGHNGAGKTTTTFMLCGIYAPDGGTAHILGSDIKYQMEQIRTSLGFCPQHDILYDDLTVAEHIDLIASIKGYNKQQIKEEILKISELVGLEKDLEKKSKQLSGGMKRRLSVAMAVTGGSKIIILDEPTSGLDPFNRRGLWELIRKFKKDRSIILTTHFMEEADALSDRIAIMNHGQVKCAGSPIFLKNVYGSGYRLVLAKNNSFNETEFNSILKSTTPDLNLSTAIETNIAAEMIVSIPFSMNNILSTLLSTIEKSKEKIGIDGYGISSPTIEEVFIKIGSIDKNNEETEKEYAGKVDPLANAFSDDFEKNTGFKLFFQQIKSLFIKRFYTFGRRVLLAVFIIGFPMLIEIIMAAIIPGETNLINTLRGTVTNYGTNNLNMKQYGLQQIPYYIKDNDATLTGIIDNNYKSNIPLGTFIKYSTDTISESVLTKRKENSTAFLNDYYLGLSLENTGGKVYGTLKYSTLAFHSPAVMLSAIDNIILQAITGNTQKSITTVNSPIASSSTLSPNSSYLEVLACLDSLPVSLLNFVNSIIIAFIISIMVMAMTKEKTNGSKQLQLLSGIHYSIYWISNYLFDYCVCLFQLTSLVICLKIVDAIKNDTTSETYAIAGDETLGYFFVLLLFSAFSWCTLAYIWSFFFKQDIVGFIVLFIILAVIAFLDMILTFVELLFQQSDGSTSNGGANFIIALRWILTVLLPNLTVKRGLYNLKIRKNDYCIDGVNRILYYSYKYQEPPFSMTEPGIGLMILICVLQFLIGNVFLYLLEARPFSNIKCSKKESSVSVSETDVREPNVEEDVKKEGERIRNCEMNVQSAIEPLIVNSLYKRFEKGKVKFLAVNNLSFGISNKECFGLLGLNGAGKTTTFKILTGELSATSGEAFINGYDIKANRSKARRSLGFCPQFDYLPEYLTVTETFHLYAGLRGLDTKTIDKTVDELTKVFKLNEMTKKMVQNLSGGNKRKVSAAIAFIGRPSVVILDEPTSGMDPAARRYLWTVIKKARDLGMTIVLTTHSMEESEALSTKLGIMVNGQFKCYGSVQHLKNKFGKGYSLILKCKHQDNLDSQVNKIEEFVEKNITGSKQTDKQQETLFYQISNENGGLQTIAELFSLIEKNKESLNLETYSLSQTSLEQVFLSFAKEQKAEMKKSK